jgi:hypothetical protein
MEIADALMRELRSVFDAHARDGVIEFHYESPAIFGDS